MMRTVVPFGSGVADQARIALGSAADPDLHLARASRATRGNDEHADRADHGFVASHNLPPLKCERRIDSLATAGGKATFR